MLLEICGSAGSYPAPGRACSSYLVREDTYQLLLDVGNGSMANLFAFTTPDLVDAVVITHEHTDHLADFVGLFHYRRYASHPQRKLVLCCTPGVVRNLSQLISDSALESLVEVVLLEDDLTLRLGPFNLWSRSMAHPVETYGLRIRGSDGAELSYSADTGPCEALEALSSGTDLLLCESTWISDNPHYPRDLHLSADLAGAYARLGGVGHLVLTHVAYPNSPAEALRAARAEAPMIRIDSASDRDVYVVGPRVEPKGILR